jgi:hypothetical protein
MGHGEYQHIQNGAEGIDLGNVSHGTSFVILYGEMILSELYHNSKD